MQRNVSLPFRCPETGEEIITSDSCKYSTSKFAAVCGVTVSNIIICKIAGKVSSNDIVNVFLIIDNIILHKKGYYGLVFDVKLVSSTSNETRKYLAESIMQRKVIVTTFFYNVKPLLRISLDLMRKIYDVMGDFTIVKNAEEAMNGAHEVVDAYSSEYCNVFSRKSMETCPYSGLSINRDAEFQNLEIGTNYKISYLKIGDNIMLTKAVGDMSTILYSRYYDTREKFINTFFGSDGKFVEIHDVIDSTGSPRKNRLRYHWKKQSEFKGRVIALIYNGSSRRFRIVMKTLFYLLGRKVVNVYFSNNVKDAILKSVVMYNRKFETNKISSSRFISKEGWTLKRSDFKFQIKVIPGKVLLGIGSGTLKDEYVDEVNSIQEMAVNEYFTNKDKKYYRIGDYTDMVDADYKARRIFAKHIKKMAADYKAKPFRTLVVGANKTLRVIVSMAPVLHNIIFFDNLEEALEKIRKIEDKKFFKGKLIEMSDENDERFILNDDMTELNDEMVSYLGTFWWNESGEIPARISHVKVFDPIFEALDIVKADVKEILVGRDKYASELEVARLALVKTQNELVNEAIEVGRAENENALKRDFLANMSHELRTPMHAILNFARFGVKKLGTVPDDKIHHYYSTVRETAESLLGLLNDLLDLSKLESGNETFSFEDSSINQIVEAAINEIEGGLNGKKSNIVFNKPTFPDPIFVDIEKITKVIMSLMSNSVKSDDNIINVELDVTKYNKDFILLSIIDKSRNMTDKERSALLELFSQTSHTYNGAAGLGLNLSIAKEIIKGHSGDIWIDSSYSDGVRIVLKFPVKQSEVSEIAD